MSAARFLADLFESGRVLVAAEVLTELDTDVDAVLESAQRIAAENLAGAPPQFSLPVARWAALLLYRTCQFVVCRDIGAEKIEGILQEKCPAPHSPETDYSADLAFQYLPDVIGMTRAVASGDPLVQQLLTVAREWPLSSVGVPGVGAVEVESFIGHFGLRQLYVDRIIARQDVTRLGNPLVDTSLRETLGAFPDLCKPIALHLSQASPEIKLGDSLALDP